MPYFWPDLQTISKAFMLHLFGKKKVTDNQIANIFVNGLLESVEKGWPIIADYIMDSPEFVKTPEVDRLDYGKFLMIVVTVNYHYLPNHFEQEHAKEIIRLTVHKFAHIFGISIEEFAQKAKDYKSFLKDINGSNNKIINAMGKGVLHKYNLVEYQDDFYKKLKTENPVFSKNLDELMENYIWDWIAFKTKYKLKESSPLHFF